MRVGILTNKMTNFYKYIVISMYASAPVMVLGLSVGTSRIDISSIIFVFLIFILFVKADITLSPLKMYSILFFLSINVIIYLVSNIPIERFLSAACWLLCAAVAIISKKNVNIYYARQICNVILIATLGSTALMIYQFFLNGIDRPKAFFDEPTRAGLFLIAFIVSKASSWLILKEKITVIIISTVIFVSFAIFLTATTHLLSGICAFTFIYIYGVGIFFNIRLLLFSFLFILAAFVASQSERLQYQLDFQGKLNISQLSWLQGFDQARAAFAASPIFGVGFGGTGTFEFFSEYSSQLADYGVYGLNMLDAYSGFFRLFIETGLLGVVVLFYSLHKSSRRFFYEITRSKSGMATKTYNLEVFSFSVTILFGILLKEPQWSSSIFPITIFGLFFNPFNDLKWPSRLRGLQSKNETFIALSSHGPNDAQNARKL